MMSLLELYRGFTVHGTDAVDGDRQPYGPPGFYGLLSNYYATLCAQFAAIGGEVSLGTIKESLV